MTTLASSALSQLSSSAEILQRLTWHRAHGIPLALFLDCLDAPRDALIHRIDTANNRLLVLCQQEDCLPALARGRYAAIGSTAFAERFMGSGQFQMDARNPYALHLALPQWLDMVNAGDGPQNEPIDGLSLHISHPDPHQNDQVCRVLQLNLGRVLVEWNATRNGAAPAVGQLTHPALAFVYQQWMQLGPLRVDACRRTDRGLHIELAWDPAHTPDFNAQLQVQPYGSQLSFIK